MLNTYRRRGRGNQETVQALQVARPYRKVKHAFPRSHQKNQPSGKLDYIRLVDAEEGSNRAKDGDWIIRHPNGSVEVVPDDTFTADYRPA